MNISRRSFVRASAIALACAAAGIGISTNSGCSQDTEGENDPLLKEDVEVDYWKRGVCRYCGVGCGVLVGVKDEKVVSVVGDPDNKSSKGLNCVKGYHLARVIYSENRLTTPLIRDDASTKGSLDGFREASWDEALDLVAEKLIEASADPSRIALWTSGQNTITEGYVCSKFWKAGLLSNNIDPNARLCMASAVVAFMDVFQTDEPAGSYQDLDLADVFVTWGANMAEAHPVLYSRLIAHHQSDENCIHVDLGTAKTRTSVHADKFLCFTPQTDLAIANSIANYIVENELYDKEFLDDHIQFKAGTENLGHAYKDDYDATDAAEAGKSWNITFEEYAEMLKPYTFEYASELSGVSVEDLQYLADLYADPDKKVMSLWTMGVNQHSRGTWMNCNIYNLHLLTGKIAQPGCGPFSLTGQPSACGTAREVGTFAHRLPADLVVANPQHRRFTEAIWDLPEGYLDAIQKPGMHTTKIFREMSKGNIDFLWTTTVNFAQSMPKLNRFLGHDKEYQGIFDTFVVVNDVFHTESTKYANVVFPAAFWVEKEGQYGNAERRTTIFEKAVEPIGDAKPDVWIFLMVAKRVLADKTIGDAPAFDHLFGEFWDSEIDEPIADQRELSQKIFSEYRIFSNPKEHEKANAIDTNASGEFDGPLKMEAKQLAPYDAYLENSMTWPVREIDGEWVETTWRFADGDQAEGFDEIGVAEYGKQGLKNNISFYKSADQKPTIFFRPYEAPPEIPDEEYPFWFSTGRLLEHWHTGTMTREVPELTRALPEALLYMNKEDADDLGLQDNDIAKITSRHGSIEIKVSTAGRVEPPRGSVFAPFFDPEHNVNRVCFDYYCPLSKEPDYKKTTIKIEKA